VGFLVVGFNVVGFNVVGFVHNTHVTQFDKTYQ